VEKKLYAPSAATHGHSGNHNGGHVASSQASAQSSKGRRKSDEDKKLSAPPHFEKVAKSKADKASVKTHIPPPTYVYVEKADKGAKGKEKMLEVKFEDATRKPLFYVNPPHTNGTAPKAHSRSPVVETGGAMPQNKGPSLMGNAREVEGLPNDNPNVVVKLFVRDIVPQGNTPNTKPAPTTLSRLLEQQKLGVTKILRRPLAIADAPQRVTFDYR